jgi:hypothetical protein
MAKEDSDVRPGYSCHFTEVVPADHSWSWQFRAYLESNGFDTSQMGLIEPDESMSSQEKVALPEKADGATV